MRSWGHAASQDTKCPLFGKEPGRCQGRPWCCFRLPEPNKTSWSSWACRCFQQLQVHTWGRFTPGTRTEPIPGLVLHWPEASKLTTGKTTASPCTCSALTHSRTNLVTQEGRFPLDVAFMLPFWLWNLLKFGFLLNPGLKDKQ